MKRSDSTKKLENKVAVITGGCSGIGLSTLEAFVAEGARVVIGDIQDERGKALEARFDGQVVFQHCDVMQESDIQELMSCAVAAFGGLDVLFNNAGVGGSAARIDEIDGAAWDATNSVLLRSVALGIRYAVPHMKVRGGGSIVNTASIAALTSGAAPVAYSTAKAGVLHLTKVASAQLARFKIRVNAVCPGFTRTEIFAGSLKHLGFSSEQVEQALDNLAPTWQPLSMVGIPEYIANACLYFASEDSAFTTGAHLVVDGGATVGFRHSWDPEQPNIGAQVQSFILKSHAPESQVQKNKS